VIIITSAAIASTIGTALARPWVSVRLLQVLFVFFSSNGLLFFMIVETGLKATLK